MSSVAASNAAADTPARPVQSQRDTADKGGGTWCIVSGVRPSTA
jgi:hypothetical protein